MKYLVALLCAAVSAPVFSQTFAVFRGDAQHSGIYPQLGVPLLHGIKWKFKTGSRVTSSSAVYNGRVYFTSYDGNIYAVDAKSGERRWKLASEGGAAFGDTFYDDLVMGVWNMLSIGALWSSPVIERAVIYFGSTDGNVYAIS